MASLFKRNENYGSTVHSDIARDAMKLEMLSETMSKIRYCAELHQGSVMGMFLITEYSCLYL